MEKIPGAEIIFFDKNDEKMIQKILMCGGATQKFSIVLSMDYYTKNFQFGFGVLSSEKKLLGYILFNVKDHATDYTDITIILTTYNASYQDVPEILINAVFPIF